MTELLTESFCERCGTRYDLGTPEPMSKSRKTRGLVTGLRQFIMSTDSLEDSIGDAMRAEEDVLAARQIDAFQDTFNFCFDCRRYTCASCWNDDGGRCRSCRPVAGIDDITGYDERVGLPAFMPDPVDETPPMLTMAEEPAWPDAEPLPSTPEPALAWPTEDDVVPPVAAVAADAAMADAAEDDEEPIAAAAETEPEEPVAETPITPEPPTLAPRRDLRDTFQRGPIVPRPGAGASEQLPESLAARRSQLDILGIDDPGEGTVSVGEREALPYRSSGAGSAGGSAVLAAVWDASSRALEAGAGAQRASLRPCGGCGLTVSSTARFCRRCGAPQTLSA